MNFFYWKQIKTIDIIDDENIVKKNLNLILKQKKQILKILSQIQNKTEKNIKDLIRCSLVNNNVSSQTDIIDVFPINGTLEQIWTVIIGLRNGLN